jgi:NAD-dependent dihydropyrimidine dehydrogenase PreA subunit
VNVLIAINTELCTGCGACVEVCPEGAIYLVDDKATADPALCRECELCVAACPVEAIRPVSQPKASAVAPARSMTPSSKQETIRVDIQTTPEPLRAKVLPVMGAALAWAGRELVPRLTEYLLYRLDDKIVEQRVKGAGQRAQNGSRPRASDERGGGRRRRRHRGGSESA